MKRLFLLFMPFFLVTACAEKRLPEPPSDQRPALSARVPATQRPYRIKGKTYYPLPSAEGYQESGIASWYGEPFHGRKTSNGETYDMHAVSAAHKTLPMNTMVLVENLDNSRELVLRINDRGPFVRDRIIDLSLRAARELDMVQDGTARVRVTALGEAQQVSEDGLTVTRFLPHQDLGKGEFYVQLGSFADRRNAERLLAALLRSGEQARLVPFDRGDILFHRVQVYAGDTLAAARQREQTFSAADFPGAFVIAR